MPDYNLVRRLGAGAFGEVWLVDDRALGVSRAVKFVHPSRISDPTNFYSEPQILRLLSHSNIVTVEDAGTDDNGRLYVAMEYCSQGSVEDESQGGIVPIRRAIRIICDVCRGVEYAHSQGFLHRDIKPANILLYSDVAKLSDFGLATRANADGNASDYGYIAHLAPEVLTNGTTNKKTDVYALGITLYRLINGDEFLMVLKDDDDLETAIIEGSFPNRSRYQPFVPVSLKRIVNKAINIDPEKRYSSASDFRHDLERTKLVCDWSISTISNGTIWLSTSEEMEYEATLVRDSRGKYVFTLRKGSLGVEKRRLLQHSVSGLSRSEADVHIRKVLGQITAGRLR